VQREQGVACRSLAAGQVNLLKTTVSVTIFTELRLAVLQRVLDRLDFAKLGTVSTSLDVVYICADAAGALRRGPRAGSRGQTGV